LVIVRPGFRELDPGHLAMLGTSIVFAISYLVAKILSDDVPPAVIVAMLSASVTIGLVPLTIPVWVMPDGYVLLVLFCVACFATIGHFLMTMAFREAPITVTQPVTYLQLVWAVALGALFFAEPVDLWVIFGGSIILAAVSFITWREAVLKRRPVTPVSSETKY
jgi:drug/metabolite transporter (DMT)-like permease